MRYQAQLDFLKNVLQKYHIQATFFSSAISSIHGLDMGLRNHFGGTQPTIDLFRSLVQKTRDRIIYKFCDPFHCNYVFLKLPNTSEPSYFLVGPYMRKELSDELLLETMEQFGIPAQQFNPIRNSYNDIPVLADEDSLFFLILSFGELIWGGSEAFEVVNLAEDIAYPFTPFRSVTNTPIAEDTMLKMQLMERRYAFENELMQIVTQGMVHRAEHLLSGVNTLHFDRRTGDPIREFKNYCIICNTLLRKAAEQGGVHPFYLDSVSSDFASQIESSHSTESAQQLIRDMVISYCRLVKKHSTKHYSSVVQRTITYIDANLSADLSLSAIAAVQKVNPSYLSSLFRRETGETLTAHVNKKRMAQAAQLLQTTKLQIQSIAQHCGISDVNYFSKLFKKYTGVTPREYRAGGERF